MTEVHLDAGSSPHHGGANRSIPASSTLSLRGILTYAIALMNAWNRIGIGFQLAPQPRSGDHSA